ncbi:hypothetical protein GCM10020216_091260 [Nonomuraea helvata]
MRGAKRLLDISGADPDRHDGAEPIHDLTRRVIRLTEETQHAAQVLERRMDALERGTGSQGSPAGVSCAAVTRRPLTIIWMS